MSEGSKWYQIGPKWAWVTPLINSNIALCPLLENWVGQVGLLIHFDTERAAIRNKILFSPIALFHQIFLITSIGLAIFDILCLTRSFFHDGLHYWFVGTLNPMDNANPVYWPVTWPIYKFAFTGNASMTLLICVERFIFVVHPFKSKIWCSKKRTLLYICVATVIIFILTIPYFFANTWDNDGKVKPTDFTIKCGHLCFSIEDFLIRFFLPNVTLITLSTIVAIKVSFI